MGGLMSMTWTYMHTLTTTHMHGCIGLVSSKILLHIHRYNRLRQHSFKLVTYNLQMNLLFANPRIYIYRCVCVIIKKLKIKIKKIKKKLQRGNRENKITAEKTHLVMCWASSVNTFVRPNLLSHH